MASVRKESPWASLQPKAETKAASFVSETSFDGTGVVVAILDTGVDPGAAGLSVCPDGSPKIVDILDCTGSGDVDTSKIVQASDTFTITGLTGRTLSLNPAWSNRSGEWRIGVKRAFELYPRGLAGRVKEKRKTAFDKEVHRHETALKRTIAEAKTAAKSKDGECAGRTGDVDPVKDLEARFEYLSSSVENDDPGPLYDCIVWFDGENWCAAIDTTETGDLREVEAMKSYRVARQYSKLSDLDNLNYSVTICDGGDVLSICVDAGAHGTHVAGIVAAYHPDHPEQNGVAPGAKIVALKIGDTRLGSMETGPGLTRALIEAVRHKVDLINMSYGEAVAFPDKGRFVKLANEIVNKHNIIFVASAGNNGPALSTVGAPGGTSSSLISVAAAVSPDMMQVQYSVPPASKTIVSPLSNGEGITYTWSSTGPATDGDVGVSITAPGGAISPVPTWTLQSKQLMNGTSMSSPNACGCLALVLSGLKREGIVYSPQRVRRAVEATAALFKVTGRNDPLSQGHGMVQVPAAFARLKAVAGDPMEDCRFVVTVSSSGNVGAGGAPKKRGVYLRGAAETSAVTTHLVSIQPQFHEDAPQSLRTDLELRLRLVVEKYTDAADHGELWDVACPELLLLPHGGRGFSVTIDPTRLPAGLHFAKVKALLYNGSAHGDADGGGDWPLFEVPITVVKPEDPLAKTNDDASDPAKEDQSSTAVAETLSLAPGAIHRRFYTPPTGCTWADFEVTDCRNANEATADSAARLLVLHGLQLLPGVPYRDQELQKYMRLRPGSKKVFSMSLEPRETVEVSLAQFWSAPGATPVKLNVTFRGVDVFPRAVQVVGGAGAAAVRLHATLRDEVVAPSAKLTQWRRPLTPAKPALIQPLKERDIMPDGKQCFELLLEYTFEVDVACDVTPRAPLLNGTLYEGNYDAQFFFVYDSNKKLLGQGDAWPDPVKVPAKGTYTLRYQVRHDDLSALEKLKNMLVWVERAISPGLDLPCYGDIAEASSCGKTQGEMLLARGALTAVYFGEPPKSKLPKGAKPGDLLVGSMTCVKKENDLCRPKGWPCSFVVPPAPAAPEDTSGSGEEEKKQDDTAPLDESEAEKLAKEVRDLRVKALGKLSSSQKDGDWEELFAALVAEFTLSHLPLAQAKLHHLDREATRLGAKGKDDGGAATAASSLEAIVAAANGIIDALDAVEISSHFGLKLPDGDKTAAAKRKIMADKRAMLVDALLRKARAQLDMDKAEQGSPPLPPHTASLSSQFDDTVKVLQQWEDVFDASQAAKYGRVALGALWKKQALGKILVYTTKALKDSSAGSLEKDMRAAKTKAMRALGWDWLVDRQAVWDVVDNPQKFALF